jgi:glycerol-3-phosphate dehydrogenase
MTEPAQRPADLFVIGGGINGCGIARDAAGRGLSVILAEAGDLGGGTSSASTKLFHGGLRYLEQFEFRLVAEALAEREVLLRAMPHIAWPMRFVLPHHPGLRPRALLRAGLFLYDRLGPRRLLPASRAIDLARDPAGAALQARYRHGFEYSDCWVDDARLVVLNARDAAERGAEILPRTRVTDARPGPGGWTVSMATTEGPVTRHARVLVNAAGPWAGAVLAGAIGRNAAARIRLVRGSHIVTPRLFDHDRAYILQGADGRVVFAIPYEGEFTLIGTTEAAHDGDPATAHCTEDEAAYLCRFVSDYFARPVSTTDIVWRFAGVRPLYDDGAKSATAATRDYVLDLEFPGGVPLLNVFGGKITTYRRLAEAALARLAPHLPRTAGSWTRAATLPGGDFPVTGVARITAELAAAYPFLTPDWAARLIRAYGTEADKLLGHARRAADLGRDFGATLTEAELDWAMRREFARTGADVLWRRSKLGLRMTQVQRDAVADWMVRHTV